MTDREGKESRAHAGGDGAEGPRVGRGRRSWGGRAAGYDVEHVEDGPSCLARARSSAETPVDLVVLDILLPGLGGAQVMRRLRDEGSTVGFIVCTARSFKTEQDRVAEPGAFLARIGHPIPVTHGYHRLTEYL